MKFRKKPSTEDVIKSRGWHRWFAWYPVEIDGHYIWLETIERFLEKYDGYLDVYVFLYREVHYPEYQ